MKKITALFSIFALYFAFTSYNTAFANDEDENILSAIVMEMHDECPMEFQEGIELADVHLQSKFVVFYFELDDEEFELDPSMYSTIRPLMKESMNESYKVVTRTNEAFKMLVEYMVKTKKGLKIYYYTDYEEKTPEPLVIEFTTKDVKAWL
ncbi:MAG: hypothetical protein J1F20_03675 [Muribaculaceae bacterium]|nr:hypothetical protein [Muribaculaceae bacterium]